MTWLDPCQKKGSVSVTMNRIRELEPSDYLSDRRSNNQDLIKLDFCELQ